MANNKKGNAEQYLGINPVLTLRRSLGRKIVILLLLLVAFIAFSIYLTLQVYVRPTFNALERQQSSQNQIRAQYSLRNELRALTNFTREYSEWDETYDYMIGDNSGYAQETLDTEYFASLGINLVILTDRNGGVVWNHYFHPDMGELLAENTLLAPINKEHPFTHLDSTTSKLEGLFQTRLGLALVVARPVVHSDRQGPVVGSLITGVFLDDKKISELSRQVSVDMQLFKTGSNRFSERTADELSFVTTAPVLMPEENSQKIRRPGEISLWDMLTAADSHDSELEKYQEHADAITGEDHHSELIWETDAGYLRSHTLMGDIFGEPVAILQVVTPRQISSAGLTVERLTLLTTTIAALLIVLVAWQFMRRMIVFPIKRLKQHMIEMRLSGDLKLKLGLNRLDEIGTLADEFDGLAENFGKTQLKLEETRDQALALAKVKSEFLATMSHEIRTPMNGVLGMSELLKGTDLDDRQQIFVRNIQNSGDLLLNVINDILDFSKAESGKLHLELQQFDLRSLIEDTLDLLVVQAHQKGLELLHSISQEYEQGFMGDSNRIRQILINLVGNAIKFTPQGEVVVKVTVGSEQTDVKSVLVEIIDTGIGISPEQQEKIFENFSQVDSSLTRQYGGTGLGLSISTQLVNLMDGELGLQSEPGKGSCFWFKLPLKTADKANSKRLQTDTLKGLRVLIVDDNQTNRDILHGHVTAWGMSSGSVSNGEEALTNLKQAVANGQAYHLILLDWHMPGMDGLKVARFIRQDKAFANLRIVMLSSAATGAEEMQASTVEVDRFITKPVRQSHLFECLEKLMEQTPGRPEELKTNPVVTAVKIFKANVLLVEDNAINQDVARFMLQKYGCSVEIAANGVEAVEAFNKRHFDLVLMDCQMPEMDGFEATRIIRDKEASSKGLHTPIVALTANVLDGVQKRCLAMGMDDFLGKPFSSAQLQNVLETWLPDKLVRLSPEPVITLTETTPTH